MYSVVTHDGRFHSDDIFGVATLQLRFGVENIKIIRTREQGLIDAADIVLDVGGEYDPLRMRFDHHQNGAPVRANGIPYAAFGLLWKEFGVVIAGSAEIAKKIDRKLAAPIDAGDNGITLYKPTNEDVAPVEASDLLESYMPPIGSAKNPDMAFMKAVEVAREYLVRVIERARVEEQLKIKAKAVYETADDKSRLVFEELMKRDIFIDYDDVQVIVFPEDGNQKWVAVGIPVSDSSFDTRVVFPKEWAALRDEELEKVSGIVGAIFCHKNRFMFIAKTKEAAIKAATLAK